MVRLGAGWTAFHLEGVDCTFEVDQASRRANGLECRGRRYRPHVPYEEVARLGTHLPPPRVPRPGIRVFEIVPPRSRAALSDTESD